MSLMLSANGDVQPIELMGGMISAGYDTVLMIATFAPFNKARKRNPYFYTILA